MKGRVEQNSGSYKRLRLYSWLQSCVVALLVTAAVFVLWFQSIQITDTGMAPVLQDGDIILFDRLAKHFRTPRRGDAYARREVTAPTGSSRGLRSTRDKRSASSKKVAPKQAAPGNRRL